MFKKGSVFYSLFNNKCPRCQNGDFFLERNPLKLKKSLKIYDNCKHCDLRYMREPAFFYGAMYVNYGLTVAQSIITFIVCMSIFNSSLKQSFLAIVGLLILLTPLNLKLARLIWINMFVKYDKSFDKK